ncbi:MAG: hypothetical protein A3A29_00755 [Candidatus Ryanbacteria bacterium RIFCSPLOWO2_01_FULL_47_79]|nr:MAG: hypothetical protein A3A29_00755 [Candidatus Ryanbacteria bacterium RIFCSPLOWO2_01_FULL_47_79]
MEDMEMPGSFHLKSLFWGAVLGVVATLVVGFWGFGWRTEGVANQMAVTATREAVTEAMASVCVERFKGDEKFEENNVAFEAKSNSWDRKSLIKEGTWATPPWATQPDSLIAELCAEKLAKK